MVALSAFDEALRRLQAGDVVGIPTETVYGLAASIHSEAGLLKIFQIKERPFFDPLIVHCATIEEVKNLSLEWSPVHEALAEKFWPGPLTMVLPKNERVSDLITAGLPSVGLRIPRHKTTLELIKKFGGPLAAPSANKFGRTSPTSAEHVRAEFGEDVFVLDGGTCDVGIESTVLEILKENGNFSLRILRPGMIQPSDLGAALGAFKGLIQIQSASSGASPGQLPYHYQPSIPLVIRENVPNLEIWKTWVAQNLKMKIEDGVELKLGADHIVAARNLYAELRRLSKGHSTFIYFDRNSENSSSDWDPLWNRLDRAASFRFKSS